MRNKDVVVVVVEAPFDQENKGKEPDEFQVFTTNLKSTSPFDAIKLSPERLVQLQTCTAHHLVLSKPPPRLTVPPVHQGKDLSLFLQGPGQGLSNHPPATRTLSRTRLSFFGLCV